MLQAMFMREQGDRIAGLPDAPRTFSSWPGTENEREKQWGPQTARNESEARARLKWQSPESLRIYNRRAPYMSKEWHEQNKVGLLGK